MQGQPQTTSDDHVIYIGTDFNGNFSDNISTNESTEVVSLMSIGVGSVLMTLFSFLIYSMVGTSSGIELVVSIGSFTLLLWVFVWVCRYLTNKWFPSTFQKLVLSIATYLLSQTMMFALVSRNTNFTSWFVNLPGEQSVSIGLFIFVSVLYILAILLCMTYESYSYSHISYHKLEQSILNYQKQEKILKNTIVKAHELTRLKEEELEKQKKATLELNLVLRTSAELPKPNAPPMNMEGDMFSNPSKTTMIDMNQPIVYSLDMSQYLDQ